ncbi:MAG TPA: DUF58 domain-containing protein [Acidisoma sp.]|uniref:DUF58 domain-containing protein n=1 Tax=Acidisoma sp. TaxID=1872115 RepID=UPI002CF66E27|nr:DUF58 domain-containing protein [Acidisoma sp.]HTI02128.1 DUF58 domain-containing protein [Acidisoma sp.]
MPAQASLAAEALGQTLPPLLLAAERVAASVAQGVHGRRRTGRGDSFWQYRPFSEGDSAQRIDWRQSARSDRLFVRETEWEAAQTVYLWVADGEAMRWHSRATPPKRERAVLLALALAALLLRGGEYVRLLGAKPHPASGRPALPAIADLLDQPAGEQPLPPPLRVPRHAHLVLIGDFLEPLESIRAAVTGFAGLPVSGHILQVLDPAEVELPFRGRVRFEGLGGLARAAGILVPKVEDIRDQYHQRLTAQVTGIGAIARAAGWTAGLHRTDHSPNAALLALYEALAAR